MDITEGYKRRRNVRKREPEDSDKSDAESANEFEPCVEWDSHDKTVLLDALNKYGSKDIAAISKMLPNMPAEAIRSKISEYSTIAERLYENELIDKWTECGLYKPGDSVVPEALLCIGLFEDHPSPSEAGGYDFRYVFYLMLLISHPRYITVQIVFAGTLSSNTIMLRYFRAIYKFLYRSCFERTSFFDLSEKDRNLLCSCLSKIEKKVWPACQKEIWEYVGRVYNKRNIKKVYAAKNVHSL